MTDLCSVPRIVVPPIRRSALPINVMNVRRLTASFLRLKTDHCTGLTCLPEGVLADTGVRFGPKQIWRFLMSERADIAWEQRQARVDRMTRGRQIVESPDEHWAFKPWQSSPAPDGVRTGQGAKINLAGSR